MKNNVVLSFGSIARVKVEVDDENNSKTTRIVCDSEMQLIESINLCNYVDDVVTIKLEGDFPVECNKKFLLELIDKNKLC